MRLRLLMKVAMSYCELIYKHALSQYKATGIDKVLHFSSSFFDRVNQKTTKALAQVSKFIFIKSKCFKKKHLTLFFIHNQPNLYL